MRWRKVPLEQRELLTQRREAGKSAGPLDGEPELPSHLARVWAAFWELEGDRAIGAMGGLGPIPLRAALAWLDEEEVEDREERSWFRELWRAMDGTYLTEMAPPTKDGKPKGRGLQLPTGLPGMAEALAKARTEGDGK